AARKAPASDGLHGSSAKSANAVRYSSVRLAPSHASPRAVAHAIDRKLHSVKAASAPRYQLDGAAPPWCSVHQAMTPTVMAALTSRARPVPATVAAVIDARPG